jgi:hypothetical protein
MVELVEHFGPVDASLAKEFAITERLRLRLRPKSALLPRLPRLACAPLALTIVTGANAAVLISGHCCGVGPGAKRSATSMQMRLALWRLPARIDLSYELHCGYNKNRRWLSTYGSTRSTRGSTRVQESGADHTGFSARAQRSRHASRLAGGTNITRPTQAGANLAPRLRRRVQTSRILGPPLIHGSHCGGFRKRIRSTLDMCAVERNGYR